LVLRDFFFASLQGLGLHPGKSFPEYKVFAVGFESLLVKELKPLGLHVGRKDIGVRHSEGSFTHRIVQLGRQ
jgi:hypothetical protein